MTRRLYTAACMVALSLLVVAFVVFLVMLAWLGTGHELGVAG